MYNSSSLLFEPADCEVPNGINAICREEGKEGGHLLFKNLPYFMINNLFMNPHEIKKDSIYAKHLANHCNQGSATDIF